MGLKILQKLFISDALKNIKDGKASTFADEHAGKAFRVVNARPYQDMLFGYIYTQNSNESQYPLREMINTSHCSGCEFIRTADENE